MDTTHLVRVALFWDSEHAKDAYGPYFTGVAKRTWTFTRMVALDQLPIYVYSNIRQHVMTITYMGSNEPSMLYPDIEEDDEDDDDADQDYDVSSASDNNNGDNDEKDDNSTVVNRLSSTTVN
ncbi:hypothetical protein M9H77_08147 [Catharanthus roseus]|uniref:Uncharacterized protein n=1 Tax=Catharanthus roseus TaxID=4058 RepID=A0ACC0BWW5_CATRO|nr:hypothetical protein M9H77_08147 [Catharanthus roseus]